MTSHPLWTHSSSVTITQYCSLLNTDIDTTPSSAKRHLLICQLQHSLTDTDSHCYQYQSSYY